VTNARGTYSTKVMGSNGMLTDLLMFVNQFFVKMFPKMDVPKWQLGQMIFNTLAFCVIVILSVLILSKLL